MQKNIIIVASLVVGGGIVLGSLLIRTNPQPKPKIPAPEQNTSVTTVSMQETQKDTDGDGMKDWEEELAGTDPNDPHSNQKDRRTARIPAQAAQNSGARGTMHANTGNETLTASLSQSYINQYFANFLRTEGTLSEHEKQQALRTVIQETRARMPDVRRYTIADISVIAAETPELRQQYGNQLTEIAKRYADVRSGKELQILRSVTPQNPEQLERLEEIVARYESLIQEYRSMRVPKSAQYIHLRILNTAEQMKEGLRYAKRAGTDPIIAMEGIRLYDDALQQTRTMMDELSAYFTRYGVTSLPGTS